MVWWIDSDRYCVCKSRFFYHETSSDFLNDRIFQTTGIVYSIDDSGYDKYEIISLIKSGVNIFNVDRTILGDDSVQRIKELLIASKNFSGIFPMKYNSPIGLAVTMTLTNPVDIDESIDIIILKDVESLKELLDFKNSYNKTSKPVMLWIKSWNIEDLKSMIQFTDGVFLDVNNYSTVESYSAAIQWCKQGYKSVFFVIGDIIQDYHLLPADDLRILSVVNKIVKFQFDGVMVIDYNNDKKIKSKFVQSLVRAIDVIEKNTSDDFYELCFMIKTPVLPWISASIAATLAAKHSGASVIIVLTTSGMSARWIANASPPCSIIAITTRKETAKCLHLYRKVIPLHYNQTYAANWNQECWNRIVFGTNMALDIGLCSHGSKVVILMPFDQDIRYCNSLQIFSIPLKCQE